MPTNQALEAMQEAFSDCAESLNSTPDRTVRGLLDLVEESVAHAEKALGFNPGRGGAINWLPRVRHIRLAWTGARTRAVQRWHREGWSPRSKAWLMGRDALIRRAEQAATAGERLARLVCRANGGVLPPDPS